MNVQEIRGVIQSALQAIASGAKLFAVLAIVQQLSGTDLFELSLNQVYIDNLWKLSEILKDCLLTNNTKKIEEMLKQILEKLEGFEQLQEENKKVVVALKKQTEKIKDNQDNIGSRCFLYLASDHYASENSTFDIALQDNFIWRSYYKNKQNNRQEANAHVGSIRMNDIIVLAYRLRRPETPNFFRVLSPFKITGPKDNMQLVNPDHTPFVQAIEGLDVRLAGVLNNYPPDPQLRVRTGLPVRVIPVDYSGDLERIVFDLGPWPSPGGNNAIWPLIDPVTNQINRHLPEPICTWMQSLIQN